MPQFKKFVFGRDLRIHHPNKLHNRALQYLSPNFNYAFVTLYSVHGGQKTFVGTHGHTIC